MNTVESGPEIVCVPPSTSPDNVVMPLGGTITVVVNIEATELCVIGTMEEQ